MIEYKLYMVNGYGRTEPADPTTRHINDIKVVKLSAKKIRVEYNLDIISPPTIKDGIPTHDTINQVSFKVRYKINDNGQYSLIYPKRAFLAKLSNYYGVKMKTILYDTMSSDPPLTIDGYSLLYFISCIRMTDENWYKIWKRDSKLRSLISLEV